MGGCQYHEYNLQELQTHFYKSIVNQIILDLIHQVLQFLSLQQFQGSEYSEESENPQQTSTATTATFSIDKRIKRNSGNQINKKVTFEIQIGNNQSIIDQLALNIDCNAETLYQNEAEESSDYPRVQIQLGTGLNLSETETEGYEEEVNEYDEDCDEVQEEGEYGVGRVHLDQELQRLEKHYQLLQERFFVLFL